VTVAVDLPWHFVEAAADFVRRRTGLVFPETRRASFAAALTRACRRAGEMDPADYLARLGTHPPLLDDLIGEITVGETYFFREPRQFDIVRDEILPALAARHRRDRPVRIWSAACATGEEPYTLAILVREQGLTEATEVTATDLSREALTRARRARYSRWSLRGVSDAVVGTYFRPDGDRFELIPAIREAVEFRYLNLAEESYPTLSSGIWGMDLILCRNVLIYFDLETVARVARRLIDSLADDGWLLLGASDPPLQEFVACDVTVTPAGVVYRRPGQDAREPLRPAVSAASFVPWSAPPVESPPFDPLPPAIIETAPPVPDDPEEARRLYAERAYEGAAALARRLLRRESGDPGLWIVLVRALANQGDLVGAGRASAAALDRHPASAELHYLHAVLLSEAGRSADSVEAFRRALYLDRGLVVVHLALAGSLSRCGDLAGARRALHAARRALAATPADAIVPASDGESAGRLAEMTEARLELLRETAVG
jgi:chemotaxis protein methyltransferase CheR